MYVLKQSQEPLIKENTGIASVGMNGRERKSSGCCEASAGGRFQIPNDQDDSPYAVPDVCMGLRRVGQTDLFHENWLKTTVVA